jgi:hypothetical protein
MGLRGLGKCSHDEKGMLFEQRSESQRRRLGQESALEEPSTVGR